MLLWKIFQPLGLRSAFLKSSDSSVYLELREHPGWALDSLLLPAMSCFVLYSPQCAQIQPKCQIPQNKLLPTSLICDKTLNVPLGFSFGYSFHFSFSHQLETLKEPWVICLSYQKFEQISNKPLINVLIKSMQVSHLAIPLRWWEELSNLYLPVCKLEIITINRGQAVETI